MIEETIEIVSRFANALDLKVSVLPEKEIKIEDKIIKTRRENQYKIIGHIDSLPDKTVAFYFNSKREIKNDGIKYFELYLKSKKETNSIFLERMEDKNTDIKIDNIYGFILYSEGKFIIVEGLGILSLEDKDKILFINDYLLKDRG